MMVLVPQQRTEGVTGVLFFFGAVEIFPWNRPRRLKILENYLAGTFIAQPLWFLCWITETYVKEKLHVWADSVLVRQIPTRASCLIHSSVCRNPPMKTGDANCHVFVGIVITHMHVVIHRARSHSGCSKLQWCQQNFKHHNAGRLAGHSL